MQDSTIEREREALIQLVTEAYSRGDMEMPAFERAVTRLNVCADRSALEAEAGVLGLSLPVLAPQMAPPQAAAQGMGLDAYQPAPPSANPLELSCVSGSIRMTGEWVKARTTGSSSSPPTPGSTSLNTKALVASPFTSMSTRSRATSASSCPRASRSRTASPSA